MRIGVDGRELAPHPTGVGRYLLEILHAWTADPEAADCDVAVYVPSDVDLSRLRGPGARIRTRVLAGLSGTAWEQIQLPLGLLNAADVVYAPAYAGPIYAPAPLVLTIHDVSFAAHPEWFPWREGARRRWTCRVSAANAARILTDSAFSRDEIVRWLGIPAATVRVAPLGVSDRVRPRAAAADDAPPLVLSVGTLLNRRHVPDLVRAFAPLVQADPRARLVLVGANRTWPPQDIAGLARDLGLGGVVVLKPWVTDAELASLYGAATAFAWLSTYEGFGLPPLEAMAAGVPVVAYDTAVAREVYADAARLVGVGRLDEVTAALRALCLDPVARAERRAAGLRQAGRFSWTDTARRTLAALREAAS